MLDSLAECGEVESMAPSSTRFEGRSHPSTRVPDLRSTKSLSRIDKISLMAVVRKSRDPTTRQVDIDLDVNGVGGSVLPTNFRSGLKYTRRTPEMSRGHTGGEEQLDGVETSGAGNCTRLQLCWVVFDCSKIFGRARPCFAIFEDGEKVVMVRGE